MIARHLALLALAFAPTAALAQAQLIAPQAFSAYLDLRASYGDGEKSWLAGGFGKTRVSGDDARIEIGEAALAWTPDFNLDWSGVVEGEIQPDHDRGFRLGEAYLKFKPLPINGVHFSARAGLFYPPVSQEHEGVFWAPADTITPSAINSWIGEEVKVVAVEASASRNIAGQSIGTTAGVFGFNDTAGTLLATRGWSLDDVKTNATGHYTLPPLSDFLEYVQAPVTNPVRSLDNRAGYYGRIDWRPVPRLALNAFAYENLGDLTSVSKYQWAWDTRFVNLGANLAIDDDTRLMSQVMFGSTRMGYGDPDLWVNTDFSAAYLMLTRWFGADSASARADVFRTRDRTDPDYGLTQEHGWALTVDYRKTLTEHLTALVEILHVDSDRPARADILAERATQTQTVAQAALRVRF